MQFNSEWYRSGRWPPSPNRRIDLSLKWCDSRRLLIQQLNVYAPAHILGRLGARRDRPACGRARGLTDDGRGRAVDRRRDRGSSHIARPSASETPPDRMLWWSAMPVITNDISSPAELMPVFWWPKMLHHYNSILCSPLCGPPYYETALCIAVSVCPSVCSIPAPNRRTKGSVCHCSLCIKSIKLHCII